MVTASAPPPIGDGPRPARDEDVARLLEPTILRLTKPLGRTRSAREIYLASIRAMDELRGSIDDEALPEMVGRLVAARLG